MKNLNLIFLLLILPIMYGCSGKNMQGGYTGNYLIERLIVDQDLVGVWAGKRFDQETGKWQKWIQNRKSDGTFTLHLKYYDKKHSLLSDTIEKGYWWTRDDLFYSVSPERMTEPESYRYKFINANKVEYTSSAMDSSTGKKSGYSFADTRILEKRR